MEIGDCGQLVERRQIVHHPHRTAVRAGDEIEVPLGARLAPDALRGTVDVVVTAWIDGHPYERGATWSLTTRPPETGRVVERPGRLSVREVSVGRATR